LFGVGPARAAECIYCNCNKTYYDDIPSCQAQCKASLGCFVGICGPAYGSDFLGGKPPTPAQDSFQRRRFPKLTCYSVTGDPTPRRSDPQSYNCIAFTVGLRNIWTWDVVDSIFGNKNGLVEVADFDRFYSRYGYNTSASCAHEAGKQKVALYGYGGIEPTHAALQKDVKAPGEWWESKEGESKRIIHKLRDLEGVNYGQVIKCYERARPAGPIPPGSSSQLQEPTGYY
jgi:hypothetical protein